MAEEEEEVVRTFEDLGLDNYFRNVAGCETPSKLEVDVIPHALQGKDLMVLAPNGSNRIRAFALPMLQIFIRQRTGDFFACVLSPTRDLVLYIHDQLKIWGSKLGIRLAKVATPGRLKDYLIIPVFSLGSLKYLVLDEADRLLNEDFEKSRDDTLNAIPRERQICLLSATMTEKVEELQKACLIDPVKVEELQNNPVKIEGASEYSNSLEQYLCFIPDEDKDCYLVHILSENRASSAMVFTEANVVSRPLASLLRNLGHRAIPIDNQMGEVMIIRTSERWDWPGSLTCALSPFISVVPFDMVVVYF